MTKKWQNLNYERATINTHILAFNKRDNSQAGQHEVVYYCLFFVRQKSDMELGQRNSWDPRTAHSVRTTATGNKNWL